MTLPASSLVLPKSCIMISHDAEANRNPPDRSFVPGSTISLGFAAFLWPERTLVPMPMSAVVWSLPVIPATPTDPTSAAFWDKHPDAAMATGLSGSGYPPENVEAAMSTYFGGLLAAFPRPLAFLARPHAYDAAHLMHMVEQSSQSVRPGWLQHASWHDIAEVLAKRYAHTEAWAKGHFERHLPLALPHLADIDSLLQGLAFIKAYGPDTLR